jgi:hypothetical protein
VFLSAGWPGRRGGGAATPAQKEAARSQAAREEGTRIFQKEQDRREVRREAVRRNQEQREAGRAVALLNYAKKLLERGETEKAKERLAEIVKEYPNTDSGREAKKLLEANP